MRRLLLLVLESLLAVTAIYGGCALAICPNGSLLQMPLSWLEPTPFKDYFIPGIILAVVVGGSAVLAFLAVLLHWSIVKKMVLYSALMVSGWIIIQILLLGLIFPQLQIGYLVLGGLILLLNRE